MANQKIRKDIERSGLTLEVDVYYNKGGMNYFTGSTMLRGYYLSVTPVQITKYEGGLSSRSFVGFSGTAILLSETKRFSEKGLNEAVELAKDKEEKLIAHVLEKNKAMVDAVAKGEKAW